MKIESVRLRNFRNIKEAQFDADSHLNLFFGKNGEGKTSVVEALCFLANLRSFRSSKVAELLKWEELFGSVECKISDEQEGSRWETNLKVHFERTANGKVKKAAFINDNRINSAAKYLAGRFDSPHLGFHAVVFNPADHELVRGEPKRRRIFLNQAISAEDPDYLEALLNYQRALEHRNALLQAYGGGRGSQRHSLKADQRNDHSFNQGSFEEFTKQLVYYGAIITLKRLEWLRKLENHAREILPKIAPKQSPLGVIYMSRWLLKSDLNEDLKNVEFINKNGDLSGAQQSQKGLYFSGQDDLPSLQQIESILHRKLAETRENELHAKTTLVGPHRDEWQFLLGSMLLKGHGSQGEVRSALLALKLSEIEIFLKETGTKPVFLLDDFSSELDEQRREFLMKYIDEANLQVFVTTTSEREAKDVDGKKYEVSEGCIISPDLGRKGEKTNYVRPSPRPGQSREPKKLNDQSIG